MGESESGVPTKSKEVLEVELLHEQIEAAKGDRVRIARPWWRNLPTVATLMTGVLAPIAFATWSVVTGLWRAPLADAELRSREEGYNARQALLGLHEKQLELDVALFARKRLVTEILKEFGIYRGILVDMTRSSLLSYYESRYRAVQQKHIPEASLQESASALRPILDAELRSLRHGRHQLGQPDDMMVKALTMRSKWASALADEFRSEDYQGTLPLQAIVKEPVIVPLPDGTVVDVMAAAAQAYALHCMFVQGLLREADQFDGWARAKVE